MMKYVYLILPYLLFSSVALAQTELPICNAQSGLVWEINKEADMNFYTVYHAETEGVKKDSTSFQVPHDPGNAVVNTETGLQEISVTMPVLEEGTRFFRVSATDQKGSESELSNEVGCTLDFAPKTPIINLRFGSE